MKKNRIAASLAALTLCLSLAACSGGGTAPTPADSAAPGGAQEPAPAASPAGERLTLTVGFDAAFPPYGYRDDSGEYVGFDLDLAQEVCDRNGWELVKQPIDWDSKDMELNAGTIDCIWNGFTKTEELADKYTWSEPYVDNSQVVVVRSDSGIETLADLAGRTVAVQTASSALSALESEEHQALTASFAALEQIPEYNTAFMSLESGAVDAVAMDVGVAAYQIGQRDAADYKLLDETLASEVYAIGFKLGNDALRDQVQQTLNEMAADGTVGTIVEKWSGMGLSADSVTLGK